MLSQLEARKQQLVRYEQSMRVWESRARNELTHTKRDGKPYHSQQPHNLVNTSMSHMTSLTVDTSSHHRPVSQLELNRSLQFAPNATSQMDCNTQKQGTNVYAANHKLGDQRQSWSASQLSKPHSPTKTNKYHHAPLEPQRKATSPYSPPRQFSPLFIRTLSQEMMSRSQDLLDNDEKSRNLSTSTSHRNDSTSHNYSQPQMSADSGYTSPNRTSPYTPSHRPSGSYPSGKAGTHMYTQRQHGPYLTDQPNPNTHRTDEPRYTVHRTRVKKHSPSQVSPHGQSHVSQSSPPGQNNVFHYPSSHSLDVSGFENSFIQPQHHSTRPTFNEHHDTFDRSFSSPDSQRSFMPGDARLRSPTRRGSRRVTEI